MLSKFLRDPALTARSGIHPTLNINSQRPQAPDVRLLNALLCSFICPLMCTHYGYFGSQPTRDLRWQLELGWRIVPPCGIKPAFSETEPCYFKSLACILNIWGVKDLSPFKKITCSSVQWYQRMKFWNKREFVFMQYTDPYSFWKSRPSSNLSRGTNWVLTGPLLLPSDRWRFGIEERQKLSSATQLRTPNSLSQASATYGTRAKRGTWNDFQWHAKWIEIQ